MDNKITGLRDTIRRFRQSGFDGVLSVAERRLRLDSFLMRLKASKAELFTALAEDLGKSAAEAAMTEYMPLLAEAKFLRRKLPKLAASRRAHVSMLNFPATGRLIPEPLGVVLVVAAWNYPLVLALEPALGAFAAGNRVVLNLSPQSPRSMQAIARLVASVFPPEEMIAVSDEMTLEQLLEERFDHIFFTGGEAGARLCMTAAARDITPVTLELGGKNPCIVDADAKLDIAARRIAWGKFTNAGQTCIAPDFILAHRSVAHELVDRINQASRTFYGKAPLANPDYPRIVNPHHFERLCALMGDRRFECDRAALKIAPTVIENVEWSDPLMEREIFGPLLPVVVFDDYVELIARLEKQEKPLAMYCFGGRVSGIAEQLQSRTSSGALVFNDVVMHFVNPDFPFGGVGRSGTGAYHGRRTFDLFCHFKPVMRQSALIDFPMRYPPFRGLKKALIEFFCR
ncbi:MAG: aldehyde dehydrogenase family protein [Victivallaceae bacterium]|nr:aldehyde dehydrogenase family protein [Victivallaceae bacterium]